MGSCLSKGICVKTNSMTSAGTWTVILCAHPNVIESQKKYFDYWIKKNAVNFCINLIVCFCTYNSESCGKKKRKIQINAYKEDFSPNNCSQVIYCWTLGYQFSSSNLYDTFLKSTNSVYLYNILNLSSIKMSSEIK